MPRPASPGLYPSMQPAIFTLASPLPSCHHFAVPHFPRTLTAGLELELVIQDVVAEPCATLLQDSRVFKVCLGLPAGLNPVLHKSDT